MLQITRESDEIIVHEIPVEQWFYAVIVGIIFGAMCFAGLFYLTKIIVLALPVGALVFATAALLYQYDNPSTTVKVNKQGRTISIRKKSLVGYQFKIYNFEDVADLIYVDEIGTWENEHRIILPLKNGEKIELSSQSRISKHEYSDAADSLNSYIFESSKPLSAKAQAWKLKPKAD